jgi:hypothetical protein
LDMPCVFLYFMRVSTTNYEAYCREYQQKTDQFGRGIVVPVWFGLFLDFRSPDRS